MRKIACIFILICLLGNPLILKAVPLTIKSDSSKIEQRAFNAEMLNKYKADRDFQYGADYQAAESLWHRFWRWLWNYFIDVVIDPTSGTALRYISIIALIATIIYVISKFGGVGLMEVLSGKAKQIVIPYSESLENIHEIDFEPQIEKAIRDKDYRFAVRMLYLKSLKKLSDSNLISWQIDKTNSAYISELYSSGNSGREEKFVFLTRQFEYIWYGEFNIDHSTFSRIHDDFKEFNRGLS